MCLTSTCSYFSTALLILLNRTKINGYAFPLYAIHTNSLPIQVPNAIHSTTTRRNFHSWNVWHLWPFNIVSFRKCVNSQMFCPVAKYVPRLFLKTMHIWLLRTMDHIWRQLYTRGGCRTCSLNISLRIMFRWILTYMNGTISFGMYEKLWNIREWLSRENSAGCGCFTRRTRSLLSELDAKLVVRLMLIFPCIMCITIWYTGFRMSFMHSLILSAICVWATWYSRRD